MRGVQRTKDILTQKPDSSNVRRRLGTVHSLDGNTVNVTLGASDEVLYDVKFMDSYAPVVGDNVWVDIRGHDPVILGPSDGQGFGVPIVFTGSEDLAPDNAGTDLFDIDLIGYVIVDISMTFGSSTGDVEQVGFTVDPEPDEYVFNGFQATDTGYQGRALGRAILRYDSMTTVTFGTQTNNAGSAGTLSLVWAFIFENARKGN